MPYISVIMPVYNAERFLDCSVGSVLSQTFDDWELICFNDASIDRSINILNRYASSDKRIRVIDSPVNVKQGGGRNRGLLAAMGEYVMFLDADDRLASHESLATCIRAIKEENADMVLFDYETFRNDGSDPVTVSPLGQEAAKLSGDNLRRHITMHPGPIWSAVYKRTLILETDCCFRKVCSMRITLWLLPYSFRHHFQQKSTLPSTVTVPTTPPSPEAGTITGSSTV